MNKLKFVLTSFFLWRLLLFLPLFISEKFIPYRAGYEYTNLWKFIKPYFPVDSFFLYPWANFDGVHYLTIAGDGYTNNLQFFPLYPLIVRSISFFFNSSQTFGATQFFIALLLTNIFFLLSLFLLYKLIRLDFSDKIAQLSLIFLLLFPTSFFFGSIYSESLFLLLTLFSFYFIRKRQWLITSIFGAFLTLTRPIGFFIVIPLIIEFFTEKEMAKNKLLKSLFNLLGFLLIPAGLFFYSLFNFLKTGDFLYFLNAQGNLANGRSVSAIVAVPQTIFRYAKILFAVPINQFEWWVALLEISTFIFISILFYIAWKKKIRFSYLLFALLCFVTPVLSGTLTGLPRYSLVLFPLFPALALVKNKKMQIVYCVVSIIILFVLLMLFSKGYFIA